MESDVYAIPVEVMRGPGEQLFDHIAASLARYHKYKLSIFSSPFYNGYHECHIGNRVGMQDHILLGCNCS